MSAPLTVTKLASCEDEDLQRTIARLEEADRLFGRDMVLQGALPDTCEDWVRLHQFVDALAPETALEELDAVVSRAYATRLEAAYLGGVAVGLRLARLDAGGVR